MLAVLLLWRSHPEAVRRALSHHLSDSTACSELPIAANVFGKGRARVAVTDTRCIQPLCALGQLADFCLALRL